MAGTRKRQVGGGRKPKGTISAKVSNFSTRITTETRASLEAEAAHSGQSISQAAERLLQLALQVKREKRLDDPIRALGHLLGLLAGYCQYTNEKGEFRDWRNDPFAFDSFARSTQLLLDQLRPPGAIEPPKNAQPNGWQLLEPMPTPKQQADVAFGLVWRWLQSRARPSGMEEIRSGLAPLDDAFSRAPNYIFASILNSHFAVEDARRALGLEAEDGTK